MTHWMRTILILCLSYWNSVYAEEAVPFKGYLADKRFKKPNIMIREIEGGSHFPWLEKPEEVKRSFEQFIEAFL
jgi:pimeloyl-ACP methyl ester carboxylesterase